MKKTENNFAVTGFVSTENVKIIQTGNKAVAHFSLCISKPQKAADGTTTFTSAFINAEAWGPNTDAFGILTQKDTNGKNPAVTLNGYFKPEEWTDKDGQKRNSITLVATNMYLAPEKPQAEPAATAEEQA